jgi:hypothetical protein
MAADIGHVLAAVPALAEPTAMPANPAADRPGW